MTVATSTALNGNKFSSLIGLDSLVHAGCVRRVEYKNFSILCCLLIMHLTCSIRLLVNANNSSLMWTRDQMLQWRSFDVYFVAVASCCHLISVAEFCNSYSFVQLLTSCITAVTSWGKMGIYWEYGIFFWVSFQHFDRVKKIVELSC